MEQTSGSIIYEYYFSETLYFLALEGFFDGMQFSRSLNDAEACETHLTAFFNSFYTLRLNMTGTEDCVLGQGDYVDSTTGDPTCANYADTMFFFEQ